jgi:2-methylaconitate cis-trans-isomerase PrpF
LLSFCRSAIGSPDSRQIDGLGGAEKLTSKVAIMGPPTRDDCDVDYLFGQVSINLPLIDWSANCGNISSGAALYGALAGAGRIEDGVAHINVHQVNTGRRMRAEVPMLDGSPAVDGEFSISGVPGSGAPILLDFSDFAGSAMGKGLFPTGDRLNSFSIPGVGQLKVSIVDMTNLHFFVHARDLKFDTAEKFENIVANAELMERIALVRERIAEEIGFGSGSALKEKLSISVSPQVVIVHEPVSYSALDGSAVPDDSYDLFARTTNFAMHKAYPGTGAIATAVAIGVPGTLVNEVATVKTEFGKEYVSRIGHPSGTMNVQARIDESGGELKVAHANVGRTARLLMDGRTFFK